MEDRQLEQGQQWLTELLRLMGITTAVIGREVKNANQLEYWLTIKAEHLTPEQIQWLIGEKGETIDTIQYLANALLNIGKQGEEKTAYTIELNGYRVQRQEELQNLAKAVATQVRTTGEAVEMKSLSAAERRQIHNFLSLEADLETESRGQEPDRRLVVRLR